MTILTKLRDIFFSQQQLQETEYTSSDLDIDRLYSIWKKTYDKSVGNSWNKETFINKSRLWTFYGDEHGFVAVRKQKSGLVKLVGMAGNSLSILKGFNELLSTGLPIWGVVTDNIIKMLEKKQFIVASDKLVELIFKSEIIDPSVFGNIDISNGKIKSYGLDKFFIGNKKYFDKLLNMLLINTTIDKSLKQEIVSEIKRIMEESGNKSSVISRIKSLFESNYDIGEKIRFIKDYVKKIQYKKYISVSVLKNENRKSIILNFEELHISVGDIRQEKYKNFYGSSKQNMEIAGIQQDNRIDIENKNIVSQIDTILDYFEQKKKEISSTGSVSTKMSYLIKDNWKLEFKPSENVLSYWSDNERKIWVRFYPSITKIWIHKDFISHIPNMAPLLNFSTLFPNNTKKILYHELGHVYDDKVGIGKYYRDDKEWQEISHELDAEISALKVDILRKKQSLDKLWPNTDEGYKNIIDQYNLRRFGDKVFKRLPRVRDWLVSNKENV